jgi:signal transduction histidine kinase
MESEPHKATADTAAATSIAAGGSQADEVSRIQKLYELSLTLSGDPAEVFAHIARMIGELMEVKVVCLSEVVGDQLHFRSVYVQGQMFTDAGICPLSVTPCASVESSKDLRIYDRVMERFPDASFLKGHLAFSYCGFPALDSNGEVIAVTCLLDDRPREFSGRDQHMLRIFGQRIGMEIERDRALASLRQLNSINLALSHTNQAIVRATSQAQILERVCRIIVEDAGFLLAWVGLLDQDGRVLPVAIAGSARAYLDDIRVTADERLPEGRGPTGEALRTGRHVIVNHLRSSERMRPWWQRAVDFGIESSAAFPLFCGDLVVGALSVYSRVCDQFGEREVALLDDMAANVSFCLDSLSKSAALDRSLEQIRDVEAAVRVGALRLQLPEWSLWWSEGTPAILGLPAASVAERATLEAALGPELMSLVHGAVAQSAQTGRPVDIDLPIGGSSEARTWIRLFGVPRLGDNGSIEISFTLQDISERKRLESEVLRAADAERRRLASELHDNLGQNLFGLSLQLAAVVKEARNAASPLAGRMEDMMAGLNQATKACRTLAHGVSPMLEGGLSTALGELARQAAAADVRILVTSSPAASALAGAVRDVELYRIAQEAISNALKHARCRQIDVSLAVRGSLLELLIRDDGAGYDISSLEQAAGIGLQTMRFRAARAGGALDVRSRPGHGTTVLVRVPLHATASVPVAATSGS